MDTVSPYIILCYIGTRYNAAVIKDVPNRDFKIMGVMILKPKKPNVL